jgi:hypothetical protein
VLALAVPAAPGATSPAITFGRSGGNIRPFTIAIGAGGTVTAKGVAVGRHRLSTTTVDNLVRLARALHFFRLPATTTCPGTLPDVAFAVVHLHAGGRDREVRVRGDCRPHFTRLYRALAAAVGLQTAASAAPTFTFGRKGGNIVPYTVTIDPTGRITATGTQVSVHQVAPAALDDLLALADSSGFFSLPELTSCPGTLPDIAALEIHVTAGSRDHTASVHGGCVAGFASLYAALSKVVGLTP